MSSCTELIRLLTKRYNLVDMIIKSNNGKAFTKSLISKIPYWTDKDSAIPREFIKFQPSVIYDDVTSGRLCSGCNSLDSRKNPTFQATAEYILAVGPSPYEVGGTVLCKHLSGIVGCSIHPLYY
jgi:hypothetical protein